MDYKQEYLKRFKLLGVLHAQKEKAQDQAKKICIANSIPYRGFYIDDSIRFDIEYSISKAITGADNMLLFTLKHKGYKITYSVVKQVINNKPYKSILHDLHKFNSVRYFAKEKQIEGELKLLKHLVFKEVCRDVTNYLKANKVELPKIHYKKFKSKFKEAFPDCSLYWQYSCLHLSFYWNGIQENTIICYSTNLADLHCYEVETVTDIAGEVKKFAEAKAKAVKLVKDFEKELANIKKSCFYNVLNGREDHENIYY